jgi:GntR family transcriptional repressor for pyruvate dehydrogenase complex
MERDVEAGGCGVKGDERFHASVTAAARSLLLSRLIGGVADLLAETRIESIRQPDGPRASLAGHRAIAHAIRSGDPAAAARAMHAYVEMVSNVAVLRST